MKDSILTEAISKLVQRSKAAIAKMSQELVIRFEVHPVEHKEVEGFKYDEKGATYTGSSHGYIQTKNWMKACYDVYHIIAPSNEYMALEALVKENYPGPYQSNITTQYTFKLLQVLFKNEAVGSAIEKLNIAFLQQLKNEVHDAKATAYLSGIILKNDIILSEGCLLRKTIKSDLEQPKNAITDGRHFPIPSAVLEIKMRLTDKQHGLLQERITESVRLMRLFDVGSISDIYYNIQFDVITGGHGTSGSPHGFLHPWKEYLLKTEDESWFVHFVNHLVKDPKLLNSRKNVNSINIAFDRYSEGLLENVPIERRIMNGVMGLEALLSSPKPEIRYSLSLRVSKLLSYFGFEPLVVKTFVGQAYDIRSSFAHGGHLTSKHKNQLKENFGGEYNFTVTILNYLRVSLFIYIATKIEKSVLLKAIDDALLDVTAAESLATQLEPAEEFLKKKLSQLPG